MSPPSPPESRGPASTGSWLGERVEQAGIARYLDAIRARLWILVAIVVVALAAAVVYLALAPKRYSAQATLLVTPVSGDDPDLLGLPLVRTSDDATRGVLTLSALVRTPTVVERVARQLGTSERPRSLLRQVEVTPVAQSSIVSITATAPGAAAAQALANAFATQTVAQRTSDLHAQINALLPAERRSLEGLAAEERAALRPRLARLETLRSGPDPTLRIASEASRPTSPSSPRATLSLAAGGVIGLVLGLVTVFGLQALDPRLRREEQLRALYDLPLLARVPHLDPRPGPIAPRALTPEATEAFRTLRAAFTSSDTVTEPRRAILVTGDRRALGKTTVAVNLAASLAAGERSVILIEADLRKPSVGRALGITAPYGVASVLVDEVDLVDALVWSRAYGPRLELLLADRTGPQVIDRLSLPSAARLVRAALELADFVVIDSPPLTDVSDALALARAVDDVLLVATLGQSQLGKLVDLGELLIRQRIRPAGVVLVGVDVHEFDGYYGGEPPAKRGPFFGLLRHREERSDRALSHR